MSRTTLQLATLTLALLVLSANADEPLTAKTKYRDLIKQLVSPNAKAESGIRGDAWVKFPKGYDVAAQEKIDNVREKLQKSVAEALPYLIESLGDKRYCMTINWAEGDGYYNRSVGEICHEIIASHMEIYRDKIPVGSPQRWHRYDYPNISKKWWEARKDKSLAELQVEAIDWAIATREADNDDGRFKDTREAEIAALIELRDSIGKSKMRPKPQRLLPMMTSDVRSR